MSNATQGERIRTLFHDATDGIIIAPFIKVDALRSLLEALPPKLQLRCVTRWLPQDIAAGVSDVEVLALLEQRGNATLFLVERLHAKLYIADGTCLSGSANVTFAGFGESKADGNIEVLVETAADNPDIAATLEQIEEEAIPATVAMATAVRRLADSLTTSNAIPHPTSTTTWQPVSRHPEAAFDMYSSPPSGFLKAADQLLLSDVANCNLPPGLGRSAFRHEIRQLLQRIPMSKPLLEATKDMLFTRHEADRYLEDLATEEYSPSDLWIAFVRWMAFYFDDRVTIQEVSELALRRAQALP